MGFLSNYITDANACHSTPFNPTSIFFLSLLLLQLTVQYWVFIGFRSLEIQLQGRQLCNISQSVCSSHHQCGGAWAVIETHCCRVNNGNHWRPSPVQYQTEGQPYHGKCISCLHILRNTTSTMPFHFTTML